MVGSFAHAARSQLRYLARTRWVRLALEEFTAENAEIAEKTLLDKINMI